jgi:DNA/RNA-binding domain of Phe-tRNA-synthetase-like protein
MSKLLQDEKVAALVDKEVTKAVKAETKRVLGLIKTLPLPEDKAAAKATKELLKELMAGVKEAA